jgi:hypothetical protein
VACRQGGLDGSYPAARLLDDLGPQTHDCADGFDLVTPPGVRSSDAAVPADPHGVVSAPQRFSARSRNRANEQLLKMLRHDIQVGRHDGGSLVNNVWGARSLPGL